MRFWYLSHIWVTIFCDNQKFLYVINTLPATGDLFAWLTTRSHVICMERGFMAASRCSLDDIRCKQVAFASCTAYANLQFYLSFCTSNVNSNM